MMDKITVLFPGGFKPFTGAQMSLLNRYVENPRVHEIKIFLSSKIREGITKEIAASIIHILIKDSEKIVIEDINDCSPVTAAYKFIETASPGKYALAASKKADDYHRVKRFVKEHRKNGMYCKKLPDGVKVVELSVNADPLLYCNRTDENEGKPISGTVLREDLKNNDFENFKTNYPDSSYKTIKSIWSLLKKK